MISLTASTPLHPHRCPHGIEFYDRDGWSFFAGNYREYEEDKKRRLGEEGAKPKRIRYKPITR